MRVSQVGWPVKNHLVRGSVQSRRLGHGKALEPTKRATSPPTAACINCSVCPMASSGSQELTGVRMQGELSRGGSQCWPHRPQTSSMLRRLQLPRRRPNRPCCCQSLSAHGCPLQPRPSTLCRLLVPQPVGSTALVFNSLLAPQPSASRRLLVPQQHAAHRGAAAGQGRHNANLVEVCRQQGTNAKLGMADATVECSPFFN